MSAGFMGNLLGRARAAGRAVGAAVPFKRKAKPRETNDTLLGKAPIATPARASADVGAANRARDRVRAGGTFLGGRY